MRLTYGGHHLYIEMVDMICGKLKVLSKAGVTKCRQTIWLCLCDCGRKVKVVGYNLRSGKTKSCGCLQKETASLACQKNKIIHGHCKMGEVSHIYRVWTNMLTRCNNPKSKDYKYYGDKGVKVCLRWYKFENFLKDMGESPLGSQIDRIDNDGHYDEKNCRWATKQQQMRNTSRNHLVKYDGKKLCLAEWGVRTGLPASAIRKCLERGWSVKASLTTPLNGEQ